MNEIKVDVAALEDKIQKLRDLKLECDNINCYEIGVSGAGTTTNIVHQIDQEYIAIKTSFELLLVNSIKFLKNVRTSIVNADKEAASNIK